MRGCKLNIWHPSCLKPGLPHLENIKKPQSLSVPTERPWNKLEKGNSDLSTPTKIPEHTHMWQRAEKAHVLAHISHLVFSQEERKVFLSLSHLFLLRMYVVVQIPTLATLWWQQQLLCSCLITKYSRLWQLGTFWSCLMRQAVSWNSPVPFHPGYKYSQLEYRTWSSCCLGNVPHHLLHTLKTAKIAWQEKWPKWKCTDQSQSSICDPINIYHKWGPLELSRVASVCVLASSPKLGCLSGESRTIH